MADADTLRRAYDLIGAHDIDGVCELLGQRLRRARRASRGRSGWGRAFLQTQIVAFPDFAMTVEDAVDGGDTVVARVRAAGTHTGA